MLIVRGLLAALAERPWLILTDVRKVERGFGTLYPDTIDRMTADEATDLLKRGEFGAGSMGPKVQAAIDFLEAGGARVMIGDLDEAPAVLRGEAGTEIVPS